MSNLRSAALAARSNNMCLIALATFIRQVHFLIIVTMLGGVALLLGACRVGDLSAFSLQPNTGWPIEGKIVDSINAVNVYADNAMTVASGGGVAFRTRRLTDGVLNMQLTLQPGNSVTLQTRTTPHSDSLLRDPGVSVTIRNSAVVVEPFLPRVSVPVNVQPDVPFVVEIKNDGRWVDITVACTHIGRFAAAKPSTEWVIVRSNDRAAFTLVDPTFRPLYSDE